MTGIFIVIFILFAIGSIAWGIAQGKKANASWGEVAQRLNLHFESGGWTANRQIYGSLHGVPIRGHVFTRGSGKNRTTYTGYNADITIRLPQDFQLHKQSLFSGVAKFFGSQDIEIGDQQFDDSIVIKGADPLEIRAFPTPSRKQRILSLMHQFREFQISQDGIRVANRGLETDAKRLEANLRRMAEVSAHMAGEASTAQKFDQAIEQVQEHRYEEALNTIRESNAANSEPDSDALELEGELHYLKGDYEEAARKFREVGEAQPIHDYADAWSNASEERARRAAESPSETSAPAPPLESEVASACNAIFLEPSSRFEASRLFESHYEGKTIRWPGVLTRVTEYTYDLVFKTGPGLIAQFELHQLEGHPYALRAVTASVRLPEDSGLQSKLEKRVGDPLFFSGRLVKCDPYSGALFVEDGEIIWG